MRLAALALALLAAGACKKDGPRATVGPLSVSVPEGFTEDPARASKLEHAPLMTQNRVWVDASTKMQLGLSLAKLPHQPEWDGVHKQDLLTEMVNQELTAGDRAGLKTVKSDRQFVGEVLHYRVDGDLKGLLATSSHTALWVDAAGDCWHASAVCTGKPSQREACDALVETVRFDVETFDGGHP